MLHDVQTLALEGWLLKLYWFEFAILYHVHVNVIEQISFCTILSLFNLTNVFCKQERCYRAAAQKSTDNKVYSRLPKNQQAQSTTKSIILSFYIHMLNIELYKPMPSKSRTRTLFFPAISKFYLGEILQYACWALRTKQKSIEKFHENPTKRYTP